tara:strand:- start:274 stop:774 length:501 start_codon:yes stop_codon:yes gene_type:complete
MKKPLSVVDVGRIDETKINQSKVNIINEVSYQSYDASGNEYLINALKGEIDLSNSDIIFLTDVNAKINLKNSNSITIRSEFGKYNIKNFDTIFSKKVNVFYLESKITGEYLDFSIDRSSMVISRNVVYTNNKNILKTDVVEIDIKTKDTKIFMYDEKEKVNITDIN